jgi:thioredoxin 1
MSQVKHVSGKTFDAEVVKSEVPVLIDFYADWCMPCRMMSPILEKVAEQTAGRAKVVKINVDEEPELATAFKVSSIPALAVVRDGKVVDAAMGLTQADRLVTMLENAR